MNSQINHRPLDSFVQEFYEEMRVMASRFFRRERSSHTLQATALVHELFVKLSKQESLRIDNRGHFFAIAAQMMRAILVDHARSSASQKRGAQWHRITLNDAIFDATGRSVDVLELDAAIEKLAAQEERVAQIVVLRFFAGVSVAEAAELAGVSKRTAESDWAFARAWLHRELDGERT